MPGVWALSERRRLPGHVADSLCSWRAEWDFLVSPVPERTPGQLIQIPLSSKPVTLAAAVAFTRSMLRDRLWGLAGCLLV